MTKNSASRSESRQPATISGGMAILMGLALVVAAVLVTVAVVFALELGPQGPSQARNAKDAVTDSAQSEEQRALALAKEQERQAQALRDARQQESLDEQAAVFKHARTFSICSPDGVAYWSYAAKWDSRSRTLAPRYDREGLIVRCEFETNTIIPRLALK